jgi:hypothetical protein
MMEPRLQSGLLVKFLQRRAESEGGFAAVLKRGDSEAGAILVILAEKGRNPRVLERVLNPNGCYSWHVTFDQAAENEEELQKFLARRRKFDPDLWLIELNVVSAERFTDEMNESV